MAIGEGAYLLPASYRGIPFLYNSNSTSSGRKFVNFEYPNKDVRRVEDMGKLQATYKIQAVISGNDLTYPLKIKLFKDALEREGAGILVHPTEGIIRVFPTPYTLEESFEKVATGIFSLSFLVVGDQFFPTGLNILSAAAKVAQIALGVISVANQDFNTEWDVSPFSPEITSASAVFVETIAVSFTGFSNTSSNNEEGLTTFNNTLQNYIINIPPNTLNADNLTTSLEQLFTDYGDISTTVTIQSALMELFFRFNTTSNLPQTTTISEAIEKNRQLMNQYINIVALIFDYIFVTQTDFLTSDDIQTKSNILTNQFVYIIENNTYTDIVGNRFSLLSNNTLTQLSELRFNAHAYLDSQTANDRKIIDIIAQNDSLLSLTYSYYENLDDYETLVSLNNLGFVNNLNGEFKIISDAN